MTCAGQVKIMGGKLNLPFRLPAGQVQFSGLFLTLPEHFLLSEIRLTYYIIATKRVLKKPFGKFHTRLV